MSVQPTQQLKKMTGYPNLRNWLRSTPRVSGDSQYRHLLLVEDSTHRDLVKQELSKIVKEAHQDAIYRLRKNLSTSSHNLDPFGDQYLPSHDPAAGYPEKLHKITLQGYFGEIFAAIIAENFSPFDIHEWVVPAFLFRFHTTVFEQLEELYQTGDVARPRPGRTGDDCLAFQCDTNNRIERYIYCEAKCTPNHNAEHIKDAHEKLNKGVVTNLAQLSAIFKDYDDPNSQRWAEALSNLYFRVRDKKEDYERYNMVSYVCGKAPKRESTWLPTDNPHPSYNSSAKLEAVEVHLNSVADLIQEVYETSKPL
jgi:hypothetical protein